MWTMGLIRRTAISGVIRASSRRTWLCNGLRSLTVEVSPEKKEISLEETKKLMRLVNVEDLKTKLLGLSDREVVSYNTLLQASQVMGLARSLDQARIFARVLDDAGAVLIFRDKVYLRPEKVVDLIKGALSLDDDTEELIKEEFNKMRKAKEEIDVLAHGQVRKVLWCGLGISILHISLFIRLTFWEFSWDIMEPITFFATATGIILGYAYFLITARDPSYQDVMKRLFLSRQRKLLKSEKFDCERFKELERLCRMHSSTCHAAASIRNRMGLELDLEDALHLHSRRD